MKITIIETTTKAFTEDRILLNTQVHEDYFITPDPNKVIRNKRTGQLFSVGLCLSRKSKLTDYEEIDKTDK